MEGSRLSASSDQAVSAVSKLRLSQCISRPHTWADTSGPHEPDTSTTAQRVAKIVPSKPSGLGCARSSAMAARDEAVVCSAGEDLVTELLALAPHDGSFVGLWPGLTIYRFVGAPTWHLDASPSVSFGVFARQGWTSTRDGVSHCRHPLSYHVFDGDQPFRAQDGWAYAEEPCLAMVLQISPAIIRRMSACIGGNRGLATIPAEAAQLVDVSVLDDELASAILRFLRSLSTVSERQVLGPLYLQEIVCRVLQREQQVRMLHIAARKIAADPVAPALAYIRDCLAESLTVEAMAAVAGLSRSAFTRTFRDATGRSPYQFVKEARLDRARELVIENAMPVAEVSRAVGWKSSSHFIKEFRDRFGMTPRNYARARCPISTQI